jgi:hypothetical protein
MTAITVENSCIRVTVELLRNRLGIEATRAQDEAHKSLQAEAYFNHYYHQSRANIDGWHIEIIGELPNQVGLSRLQPQEGK